MAATDEDPADDPIGRAIGQSIRAARQAAGLSMTNLGKRCGVSQPYLSQLENGKASPSISTLYRIANALGVTPQDLLPEEIDEVVVMRRDEGLARPIEDRPDAALARMLLASPTAMLQIQEVTVEPRHFLGGFFEHDGEEFVYMLAGCIAVDLGSRAPVELGAGDGIWYPATTPHRWRRLGDAPARMLVVSASVPGRPPHA